MPTLPLIRLKEFQSTELIPHAVRGPGVYLVPLEIVGNSILSSVFVSAIDGGTTVEVKYYDTTSGTNLGERYDLTSHDVMSAAAVSPNRKTITRIHNKPVVEATVTGGNATFGVFGTVVSSFATDLDAALVTDNSVADLARNKGIPTVGYDPITGKFYIAQSDEGITLVKVVGGFSVSITPNATPAINNTTATLADTEYSYVFPAGTKKFYLKTRSGFAFKFSFTSGQSGTNFVTCDGIYEEDNLDTTDLYTIYFQSKRASEIFEILSWS